MPSIVSSKNFLIEQTCDVHIGGILDWRSANGFSFALPLTCRELIGILFRFVSKLDILALVENFPLLTSLIASLTGLLSVSMIKLFLLSLIRSYSLWMPVASASPSISQGHHFRHLSGNLTEWILTGNFFSVLLRITHDLNLAWRHRSVKLIDPLGMVSIA